MKTGTPPRVDARSLDFSKMEIQEGDVNPQRFSYTNTPLVEKQLPCYIAYTSTQVHETLKTGFNRSPMFNGRIQGLGPRYCPSIEDKINRFADKDRHQLFVEPEGWHTVEMYVNGFSSSLPEDVQYKALCQIAGFENVRMFRPGYAIEYDFFPPTQLKITLETQLIKNLFFAGQINGTTGYEEAGCQGLMAGINAHLAVREEEPFVLRRDQAYIGVLIDDLVNKGTNEPYRMFTSRAEYRLLLRQDNADIRLTPLAEKLGMANMDDRMARVRHKEQAIEEIRKGFEQIDINPADANPHLETLGTAAIKQRTKFSNLILRPQIAIQDLVRMSPQLQTFTDNYDPEQLQIAEIQLKYDSYIEREREMADKMLRLEEVPLPENFNYQALTALSAEAREKLGKMKPRSLGQASRISGVNPSDITILMVKLGR